MNHVQNELNTTQQTVLTTLSIRLLGISGNMKHSH